MPIKPRLNPQQRYAKAIEQQQVTPNEQQADVVAHLQKCYQDIIKLIKGKKRWPWQRPKPARGIYLWGEVGIGKSMLINLLLDSLPSVSVKRYHFHEWMADMHKSLTKHQGQRNPCRKIIKASAKKYKVLILDEFIVNDIADAMILSECLNALFYYGMTLITTGNTAPENLYANGAQRQRFLPAIAAIQQHTNILHLYDLPDYRQTQNQNDAAYFFPLTANQPELLRQHFRRLCDNLPVSNAAIRVYGRAIPIIGKSKNVLWIDFASLCHIPRSQLDYLKISKLAKNIIISGIPEIPEARHDWAQNLIKAIDVFYDNQNKLIVGAAVTPDKIYPSGRHAKAFLRTASRLTSLGLQKI